MSEPVRRRFNPIWPRLAEIYSLSQTGLQTGVPGFIDPDDGPDAISGIHGIQTEQGIDILTEGGTIIQAENQ